METVGVGDSTTRKEPREINFTHDYHIDASVILVTIFINEAVYLLILALDRLVWLAVPVTLLARDNNQAVYSLLHHTLNGIETLLENLHARAI